MPNYLSIRDARSHLPGRPHFNTIRRWMTDGVGGIRLRSIRFAGKRLTTEQWCAEFVAAVQARDPASSNVHQEASAKLDAMGV